MQGWTVCESLSDELWMDTLPFCALGCEEDVSVFFKWEFRLCDPSTGHSGLTSWQKLPNSNNHVITTMMSKVKADWKQTLSSPSNISPPLFSQSALLSPLCTLRPSLSRGSTSIFLHLTLRSISITLSGDYSPGEQDVTGYRLSRRTASLTICLRHVSRRPLCVGATEDSAGTMSVFWGGAHHSLWNLRTGTGRGRGRNNRSMNQKRI